VCIHVHNGWEDPHLRAFPMVRTDASIAVRALENRFRRWIGKIRKNRKFSNLSGLNLCTSHILIFGCLHGQDVVGS